MCHSRGSQLLLSCRAVTESEATDVRSDDEDDDDEPEDTKQESKVYTISLGSLNPVLYDCHVTDTLQLQRNLF